MRGEQTGFAAEVKRGTKLTTIAITTHNELEGRTVRHMEVKEGPAGRCKLSTVLIPVGGREVACEVYPSGSIHADALTRRLLGIGPVKGEGIRLA